MITERYRTLLVSLILIIAVLAVYFNVQDYEFVNYDDPPYVTENQIVKSGLNWKGIFWAFTTTHYANWHPLTWISFMFDYEIFRLRAGAYHWNNLLLHLFNSVLLFLVLKHITNAFWRSFTVAALFALHPLHVESVAWISSRKDVLSALFWLLTIYTYALYIEKPSFYRYILVFLIFSLGLMTKPMLVTLPFVLLLLDYWPLRRFQIGQTNTRSLSLFFEKIPIFILSIASCIITIYAQESSQAVATWESLSLQTRISNAFASYVKYLLKTFWPVDLAVFYPHPGVFPLEQLLIHIVLLVLITVLVLYFIRDYPYLLIGWLWYLGTLIPVIGIVQVGSQAMADRYTYIPLIGPFIMVAWGIPDILKSWHYKKLFMVVSTIMVLAILMIISWSQVQVWENSSTLFQHAIKVTPKNFIAHYNLAIEFSRQGNRAKAFLHYSEAVKYSPNFSDAHNNLGDLLARNGKIEDAIKEFQSALKADPNHELAKYNLKKLLKCK
ncbi:MAG: tetratricopeptide repeat protein [Pseudomonadota bacterium]